MGLPARFPQLADNFAPGPTNSVVLVSLMVTDGQCQPDFMDQSHKDPKGLQRSWAHTGHDVIGAWVERASTNARVATMGTAVLNTWYFANKGRYILNLPKI